MAEKFSFISLEDVKVAIREEIENVLKPLLTNQNQGKDEELLTVSEVCKMLSVTRSTLWRWQRDEYLVPVKCGKRSFYKKSEIQKIIK